MKHKSRYFKEQPQKYAKAMRDITYLCPVCKHSMVFPVWQTYKVCSWCGWKVRNNTKEHFKYMLRKKMKELEDSK